MITKKLLAAVSLLLYITNIYSQEQKDTTKVITLEEVIVKENAKTDPTLTIVKQDYTDKSVQPKNSGELFSDINGFSLIKRGNYAIDPSFRASQYEELNVQYDGGIKALHACPNRMDPATTLVNPEEVTKIEIIKGPFSVRYGPIFGGMINMVTSNSVNSTKKISGTLSSGFESNGNALVNTLQLMSKLKKLDMSGNLSYRNYGNYKDGDGTTIPSSFKSSGYSFKAGYNFTNLQRLQVSFRQNFGRDIIHAGLPMDTKFDNSSIAGLDYKLVTGKTYFKGITVKGYYSYVDHEMNNYNRPAFSTMEAVARVNATTAGGKMEAQWNLGNTITLFTGADITNISRKGNRNRLVKKNMMGQTLPVPQSFTDKVWQNSQTNQTGLFAEGKYLLSDKDIFTAGVRLDFVYANAKDIDTSFAKIHPGLSEKKQTSFSGTVAYKRLFNDYQSLEMAFGRGARPASIEERYIAFFNIGEDAYEYIGNPYLKPEINNQFEVSFKGNYQLNSFIKQFSYSASVFYSFYEHYILAVVDTTKTRKYNPATPPKNPKIFQNINKAYKTGFELMGSLQFAKSYSFTTEMSYVYSENKDFNESLPLTPPLTTRLRIGYEKNKIWAKLRYTIASAQNRISKTFDETATKGYNVLDFESGVQPVKSLKIGVGISNIFNKEYVNHLNFAFNNVEGFGRVPIPEPGRNFTVFASYTF